MFFGHCGLFIAQPPVHCRVFLTGEVGSRGDMTYNLTTPTDDNLITGITELEHNPLTG